LHILWGEGETREEEARERERERERERCKSELSLHRAQRGGCVGFNALLFFIFFSEKKSCVVWCDGIEMKLNSTTKQRIPAESYFNSIATGLMLKWDGMCLCVSEGIFFGGKVK
jgi:hypothetical protein